MLIDSEAFQAEHIFCMWRERFAHCYVDNVKTCVFLSHPHPQRLVVYRYRFQAPDSFSYDASTTKFCNELLENYAWNYLDQYICTRGEGDFGLVDVSNLVTSFLFLLLRHFILRFTV